MTELKDTASCPSTKNADASSTTTDVSFANGNGRLKITNSIDFRSKLGELLQGIETGALWVVLQTSNYTQYAGEIFRVRSSHGGARLIGSFGDILVPTIRELVEFRVSADFKGDREKAASVIESLRDHCAGRTDDLRDFLSSKIESRVTLAFGRPVNTKQFTGKLLSFDSATGSGKIQRKNEVVEFVIRSVDFGDPWLELCESQHISKDAAPKSSSLAPLAAPSRPDPSKKDLSGTPIELSQISDLEIGTEIAVRLRSAEIVTGTLGATTPTSVLVFLLEEEERKEIPRDHIEQFNVLNQQEVERIRSLTRSALAGDDDLDETEPDWDELES